MREDQLSPLLGRLIDAAKRALPELGVSGPQQVVALLTESGAIFTGCAAVDGGGQVSAAEDALAAWRDAGAGDIDAAAVAVNFPSEHVNPGSKCRGVLAEIDPDLPLVIKQRGRWVIVPLSSLPRTA